MDSTNYFPASKMVRRYHSVLIGKSTFTVDVRYTNLKRIGSGSYGTVCSADDLLLGCKVAIKRIGNVFSDLHDAKRILRELKLLFALSGHENIVSVLDIMTFPSGIVDFRDLYIVTDCYECDLETVLYSSQELSNKHHKYFLYQILRGMKFIHSANILHRDLKPGNLLVNSNCYLAICDFGLARGVTSAIEDGDKLTEYVVTRWYRAPELLCENSIYGREVDVWSIGCIFAEMLLRRPLLKGKDYLDQLKLITRLLGKPYPDDVTFLESEGARRSFLNLKYPHEGYDFTQLFPDADPLGLDLLKLMLQFNPSKRCTIEEALRHPYLTELHDDATEAIAETYFEDILEKSYPDGISKDTMQDLMLEVAEDIINSNSSRGA